jgi:hypothetical protein
MTPLAKLAVVPDVARVPRRMMQEGPDRLAFDAALGADASLRVMASKPVVNGLVARLITLPLGVVRTVAWWWCPTFRALRGW